MSNYDWHLEWGMTFQIHLKVASCVVLKNFSISCHEWDISVSIFQLFCSYSYVLGIMFICVCQCLWAVLRPVCEIWTTIQPCINWRIHSSFLSSMGGKGRLCFCSSGFHEKTRNFPLVCHLIFPGLLFNDHCFYFFILYSCLFIDNASS